MSDKSDDQSPAVSNSIYKFGKQLEESLAHEESLSESFWNSLSPEDQLWVFCAVMRRYCQAIKENRSYRGTLYSVFGWGPEAYAPAQMAGFLEIHNSVYSLQDIKSIVTNIITELATDVSQEEIEQAVTKKLY